MSIFTAKGRSIRGTRRFMRREARISTRERIGLSRVQQRAAVRTARISGRAKRRRARAEKRLGIATAGFRARQLHRAASPSGRKHRIYQGKKQKWSKKYGGWINVKSYKRRAREEVSEVKELIDTIKPLMQMLPILLAKG